MQKEPNLLPLALYFVIVSGWKVLEPLLLSCLLCEHHRYQYTSFLGGGRSINLWEEEQNTVGPSAAHCCTALY